jgi:predicted NBD/HSP70 family sugar kinase
MFVSGDIGGTSGKLAAYAKLDDPESLLGRIEFPMTKRSDPTGANVDEDLANLIRSVQSLQEQHGSPLEGVGLALAGKLNAERSGLTMAGNLDHWVGYSIEARLQIELGCRLVLGNDAEALALAEAVYGLGTQNEFHRQDFISMIWGSGVGGACVRYAHDGSYVTIPGEPGHIIVGVGNGVQCGCKQQGCLESYVGGNNLEANFRVPVVNADDPLNQMHSLQWYTALNKMVLGLREYLRVQPVGLIVFSGGVACKQQEQRKLLDELEVLLASPVYGSPKVRVSAYGETAGSLGALSLLSL